MKDGLPQIDTVAGDFGISVIIPCFNAERFLARQLQALVPQLPTDRRGLGDGGRYQRRPRRVRCRVPLRSQIAGQYTSAEFGELCDRHGVVQSMEATGVCWDNAAAESFFGTLKREHANRRRWATRADARRDLMRWIEGWYNQRRPHSSIGYNSPVDHEAMFNRHGDGIAA